MSVNNEQNELYTGLVQYCHSGIYPMHMPGHKRSLEPVPGLPYEWDVTEVEGTDDLHDAEGILKAAMERTRDLVGSKRTWYLVGGSTCGNLAAIYAMVPKGSEIIAARNCHKSVYHAIELLELKVHWIIPKSIPEFEIPGSVNPAEVKELLERFPLSAAVVMTSPTYEGIVSDIKEIARVTHAAGKLLFVDEAHGAHLGLFRQEDGMCLGEGAEESLEEIPGNGALECDFPDSAVHLGADVVVQSAHKTLPSLTQTAYLHLCTGRVSETALEQGLNIFETSSPSYPLMASLDGCTGWLVEHGKESFHRWRERIREFEEAAHDWVNLQILGVKAGSASEACRGSGSKGAVIPRKTVGDTAALQSRKVPEGSQEKRLWPDDDGCYARDPGKILIRSRKGSCTGKELQDFLRQEEGIETEMSCGGNVLLMTSCADTEEGWRRTIAALEHLNKELEWPKQCSWILVGEPTQLSSDQKETAESQPEEQTGKQKEKLKGKHAGDKEFSNADPKASRNEYVQVLSGDILPEDQELSLTAAAQTAIHGQIFRMQLDQAVGRICAEYVTPYPPGIPLLIPGEKITKEHVRQLQELIRTGARIQYSMH